MSNCSRRRELNSLNLTVRAWESWRHRLSSRRLHPDPAIYGRAQKVGCASKWERNSGCRQVYAFVDETRATTLPTMSSDAVDSSPAPLFKRSTNKKPRPRRERSPGDAQTNPAPQLSTEDVDPANSSAIMEESPMTQVAKLKAKHKSRNKLQSRLSFGGDDSDVSQMLSYIFMVAILAFVAEHLTEVSL